MPTFRELDRLLGEATETVAPAIVCRVEQQNSVLYEAAFGEIYPPQSGARRPRIFVTPTTWFDVASLTKIFTMTACLRLCALGRLTLDTPVADFLPAFAGTRPVGPTEDPITKLPAPVSPHWSDSATMVDAAVVTIRQLLTHTSGLPAWRNLFSVCGDAPAPGHSLPAHEIARRNELALAAIVAYDFAYPPGQSYLYSDIGLALLGALVATVHGTGDLNQALRDLVIGPLRLAACFNPPDGQQRQIAPTEYCVWRGRRLHGEVHDENAAGLGGVAGHAGLFATAADLCRLASLYLSDGENQLPASFVHESRTCHVAARQPGDPLPDPLRPCATPHATTRRGLGWMLQTPSGASCGPEWSQTGFGHTGYTGGSLWCDPDRDLSVALLTNRVYWGRDPEPIEELRRQVHTLVHSVVTKTAVANRVDPADRTG